MSNHNRKKIAIIFDGNCNLQKGLFNAVIERTKHLKALNKYDIDVYLFQKNDTWYTRILRKTPKLKIYKSYDIDGINIKCINSKLYLTDYILEVKLHKSPLFQSIHLKQQTKIFKNYDLIDAHSTTASIALLAHKKYNIPYIVTWHGSDIHTLPFTNHSYFRLTKRIIESASMNFFVSQCLLKTSEQITTNGKKEVSYNGIDKSKFYRLSESEINQSKLKYHIDIDTINIASVGSMLEIKNHIVLPDVYKIILSKYPNAQFHQIGSGKLLDAVKQKAELLNVPIRFWGDIDPTDMPDIYNTMDLIVIPSKNEGLSLVGVESLACGTPVIASKVGGSPEVVGEENTTPLDDNFVENFAELCIKKLEEKTSVKPKDCFDWIQSAQKEAKVIDGILS